MLLNIALMRLAFQFTKAMQLKGHISPDLIICHIICLAQIQHLPVMAGVVVDNVVVGVVVVGARVVVVVVVTTESTRNQTQTYDYQNK